MPAIAGADWRPSCSPELLKTRAEMLSRVRAFFADRRVLEVETPVMAARGATDVQLRSLPVLCGAGSGAADRRWLQTSPEYHMKRLLAAGSGPIYQIAKVFRGGECGPRHNPEFSLLEWYRPGFDHRALMREVTEFVEFVVGARPVLETSYRDLFDHYLGVDPFMATDRELCSMASRCSGLPENELDRDSALDLLLTHRIEPRLSEVPGLFVHSYPASQAALARTEKDQGVEVAHRFELYLDGLEICNGYWELTDAVEQRRRFDADNRRRRELGLEPMLADERLLASLQQGLPDCAGVALGLDRLLMVKTGAKRLDEVLAFPFERA